MEGRVRDGQPSPRRDVGRAADGKLEREVVADAARLHRGEERREGHGRAEWREGESRALLLIIQLLSLLLLLLLLPPLLPPPLPLPPVLLSLATITDSRQQLPFHLHDEEERREV